MAKGKLRKITVDNNRYLWKREHKCYNQTSQAHCAEKVVVYLEGYKNTPLQVCFSLQESNVLGPEALPVKWHIGHPHTGVIWRKSVVPPSAGGMNQLVEINLNRPAVIAVLIRYFISEKWKPTEKQGDLSYKNGLWLLQHLRFPKGIN